LCARQADLLRQLGHGLNGLLNHFATVICLFAGTAGMLRSIGGVAGNFLSGSTQLVDRRGHAVGSRTLLVRANNRCVGRGHDAVRQVMNLTSSRRHFADRRVNALNKLVERAGQLTEFVLVLNHQTARQITFALGDILHCTPHGGQRTHQHTDQQAQQQRNRRHSNKHGDQRRCAEFRQWRVRFFFIY